MTLPLSHTAALLLSYGSVGALLLVTELLRRPGRISPDAARKIVHVGVGGDGMEALQGGLQTRQQQPDRHAAMQR